MSVLTALGLVVPVVLGRGIDTVIQAGKRSTIVIFAWIIIGAACLRGLAGYADRYLREVASQQVAYDVRNAVYDRLQRLSFAYYDSTQTGDIMSRTTVDIDALRMFLREGLLFSLSVILIIGGVAYLLIALDWKLALLCLAFLPFVIWRVIAVSGKLTPIWLRAQQLIAALGTTLQENLMGIRVVKSFSRQKEENGRFVAQSKNLYDTQIRGAYQTAFNGPLMVFLLGLPTALVLWYGGRQVIAGTLTIGGVTEFILLIGMLAMPIRRLGSVANLFSRMSSSSGRILEILDTESQVKEKPNAIDLGKVKGQVSFEDVSFSYNSLGSALSHVSFSVQPGQLVALLGGSGSGKSTIASLIPRFYDVSSGRITVDGIDIRDVTLDSLRRNVIVAQQDVFLFSATIRDNIAYGVPGASMDQIVEAAKAAQIHNFILSLPDGYDTWVGERGTTLSGGEKQRMTIARALLMDPSILILDDSTSSVDAETEHLIRLALEKLIKGRTTFIITHRIPIIRNSDLIIMLKDGLIADQGKHNELMAKSSLYREIYLSQIGGSQDSREAITEE